MEAVFSVIRTDESVENHSVDITDGEDLLKRIKALIGADEIEKLYIRQLNLTAGDLMIIDDAAVKAQKPVNPAATRMYIEAYGHMTEWNILGDVAIARERDFA